jgi:glycine cleavage system aminomethyltransferase T
VQQQEVKPSGLGPRDSLRLEAGLCLYGHDLNPDITPMEAGLGWLIGKRRREQGGFPGYDVIKNQITNGVERKRVGFAIKSGAPARGMYEISFLLSYPSHIWSCMDRNNRGCTIKRFQWCSYWYHYIWYIQSNTWPVSFPWSIISCHCYYCC